MLKTLIENLTYCRSVQESEGSGKQVLRVYHLLNLRSKIFDARKQIYSLQLQLKTKAIVKGLITLMNVV